MIANTAVYRRGSKLHVEADPDDLEGVRKATEAGGPGSFVSIALHEPDEAEMERVARIFGLHRLAVEDALHPVQRPKLESYGDMAFLVLKTLSFAKESDRIESGQVAMFMGPDYVVTVRQAAHFGLDGARHEVERHADVLRQGPCAIVYAVCDHVVDVYEDVVSQLEADVDEVEAAVFSGSQSHASKRIYELNQELTTMRRAFEPLEDPMQRFARGDVDAVSADAAAFFRDVADHLARIGDAVGALDNELSGAFDANLSRIGVQQNDDMRRMSAWAAIAAVITVLAGIYGMNFQNMPELRWSLGYPMALLVMVGLGTWLHHRFKKSGWL